MITLERRYHVPRSQVWEGSGGRQRGKVHLHLDVPGDAEQPYPRPKYKILPRLHRSHGQALCGRNGWYERPPNEESERSEDALCPRCRDIALRAGLLDG